MLVLPLVVLTGLLSTSPALASEAKRPPNLVVIFCDDLGYGDLGCYGHPTIHTPNLDRMASEGQKWTQFYVGANVCTPSRAALLTGRLPVRSGMTSDSHRVLFPYSKGGLPQSEYTLAELLHDAGYATAAVGKWHLGHLPQFLPPTHGFDSYFGIPYSNDMDIRPGLNYRQSNFNPQPDSFNVPLMRNEQIVERPADQRTITRRYTDETIRLIKEHKNRPFFVYLAHNLPHVPLFCSEEFENTSRRGIYGDVVEEIDAGVGRILDTLREEGLAENTLVVFSSDNGPWLSFKTHGGSAGLLRDGKGTTFEGGHRVPGIFWWPGQIEPRVVAEMGSTLDLLPTLAALVGRTLPEDRIYDGYDLSAALLAGQPSPRDTFYYYHDEQLYALRHGPFKAHFKTQGSYGSEPRKPVSHDPPLLYHLGHDPSEQYNIADEHSEVIAKIQALAEQHRQTVEPVENQLDLK